MARALKQQEPMSPTAEGYSATAFKMSQKVVESARVEVDIRYGLLEDQLLDVYLPNNESDSPLPVLAFMHGGAWTHGYKEWMGLMAPAITSTPAIFVSIGYRLAPETKFPAPVDDCRSAVRWIFDNIEGYGGDPQNLFIGGHSAGGHLATMVVLDREALGSAGIPSAAIKGCFPVSGVYDIPDFSTDSAQAFLSSESDAKAASPLHLVAGNKVPFLLAIGENDMPRLIPQCDEMAAALGGEEGFVQVLKQEGYDHFQIAIHAGDVDGAWATNVSQWITSPPTV